MMNSRSKIVMSVAFALWLGNNLQASDPHSESHEQCPPSSLAMRVFALGDSEVKHAAARYAISSVAVELQHCHWSLGLERQYFAWENGDGFPGTTDGRDPWEFFNQLHLGFAHSHIHSENWMSEFMTGVRLGFESELNDSVSAYFGGYGTYQVNRDLVLLMGAYYTRHQQVETDFDFIPILGMAMRPAATRGWSAQLGLPTTKVCWHFDQRTRLILELNTLENGVTRLADDSPVQQGGYAELSSAALTLKVQKHLRNDFQIAAGIGHSVQRELTIYDSDGNKKQSLDIERGPSIEISIRKLF